MNQVNIYHFTVEAISPAYFGASQQGMLVVNTENEPILLGNSIGGALRDYLKKTSISKGEILKYMGGVEPRGEDGKEKFKESKIYISDGKISDGKNPKGEFYKKEGTAIDPEYGTAKQGEKYTLQYLPEGTIISFSIECDDVCPEEFNKLIGTWAWGLEEYKLMLGGQKNNGFGKFKLKELRKTVFPLGNSQELDDYIFHRKKQHSELVDWRTLEHYRLNQQGITTFSMKGQFPYGVYQGYNLQDNQNHTLSGLQKKPAGSYYLPSTSIKGLIKGEVRRLLTRMTENGKLTEKKCSELFGDSAQQGKLVFSDVLIESSQNDEIKRSEDVTSKDELGKRDHIYIKIDRLTGGAYSSALKHQREIQGEATIQFQLNMDNQSEAYIFPLLYVMRRIGAGLTPIGGRTVIGLGEFTAAKVSVTSEQESRKIEVDVLSKENEAWLKQLFDSFKRWCDSGETI